MKRALVALALLLPLAGCGPDCDKFCQKWVDCRTQAQVTPLPTVGQCVQGCNEVGSDNGAFINCVNDKSCTEVNGGHCQIPTIAPGIVQ